MIREIPDATEYPSQYASLLTHIGDNWLKGDVGIARSTLEESHKIWLELGSNGERGLANVLASLGDLALYNEGNIEKARSHFEESLKLHEKIMMLRKQPG